MVQYRIRQINLGNSKLDMFIMAAWTIVIAGLVSVEAGGIVDDVCGTQAEKDVSGVEKQLQLSDVHGIELDPLPKFTYAATCGEGKRKITKCAFTSEDATPKTSEVQLEKSNGRAKFTLKKDRHSYDCYFDCYDVMGTDLWCTFNLLEAVCGTKKTGTVQKKPIQVRTIDVKGATKGIELPTVNYDADCATMEITKCSIPSKAVEANPGYTSTKFNLQAKANGRNTHENRCSMECFLQLIASLKC